MTNNKPLIITVFIVGVIAALPHVLIPILTPSGFPKLPLLEKAIAPISEDEVIEAARINKVFQGQVFPKEGHLYEHRFTPTPREWLPHFLLGLFAYVTGSVPMTFALADLVLAPLLVYLIYLLAFHVTKSRLGSLTVALAVFFLTDAFECFPGRSLESWRHFISAVVNFRQPTPLLFTRLPVPEFSYLFYWVALLLLFRAMDRPEKASSLLAGVSWGLLFYFYPYYWEAFYCGLAVLFAFYLVLRDSVRLRWMMMAGAVAIVISVPFWIETFQSLTLSYGDDHWIRHGTRWGRYVFKYETLKFLAVAALGGLLAGGFHRKSIYLGSFLLGGLICLNQQLITGRSVLPDHWTVRVLNPWGLFFLGCSWVLFVHRRGWNFRKPAFAAVVAILVWAGWIQTSYSFESRWTQTKLKEMAPMAEAFQWLKQNAGNSDVVLSLDPEMINLLPVYTHVYNYLPNIVNSSVSFDETEDRILTAFRLLSVRSEELENILEKSSEDPARWKYYDQEIAPFHRDPDGVLRGIYEQDSWLTHFFLFRYYFDAQNLPFKPYSHSPSILKIIQEHSLRYVPASERERWLKRYAGTSDATAKLLNKYKLDFLFYGPVERSLSQRDPETTEYFEKVFEDHLGQVAIYRVKGGGEI